MKSFKLKLWIPVLLVLSLIFYLSSFPGSPARTTQPFWQLDKFVHFYEYLILGFFLSKACERAFYSRKKPLRWLLGYGIMALTFPILDEFHQSFVPYRDVSFFDILADVLGLSIAALYHVVTFKMNKVRHILDKRQNDHVIWYRLHLYLPVVLLSLSYAYFSYQKPVGDLNKIYKFLSTVSFLSLSTSKLILTKIVPYFVLMLLSFLILRLCYWEIWWKKDTLKKYYYMVLFIIGCFVIIGDSYLVSQIQDVKFSFSFFLSKFLIWMICFFVYFLGFRAMAQTKPK